MFKAKRRFGGIVAALVAASMTLVATPASATATYSFALIYDANGATSGSVPNEFTTTDSAPVFEATVAGNTGGLAKTGFVWSGWRTASDGGTVFQATDKINLGAGNPTTLYAYWVPTTVTANLSITYKGNGGFDGLVSQKTEAYTATYKAANGATMFPTGTGPSASLYFQRWSTNSSGVGGTSYYWGDRITITSNLTLWAIWATTGYSVTYHKGDCGGSATVPDNGYVASGGKFLVGGVTGCNPGTFSHWSTKSDGTGTSYYVGDQLTAVADVDLYAQSRADVKVYYVDTEDNGNSGNFNETYLSSSLAAYEVQDFPEDFTTPAGKKFKNWAFVLKDGSCGNALPEEVIGYYWALEKIRPTADLCLYPNFVTGFTVTFASGSANLGSVPDPVVWATGDPKIALPKQGNLGRFGYGFAGWTIGTGTTIYAPGYLYSPTADVTVTAAWKTGGTVFYSSNGGSGTVPDNGAVYSGKTHTIAAQGDLTQRDKLFGGWATSASGKAVYQPGDVYSTLADLQLFAVWGTGSTITFDKNDSVAAPATGTMAAGVFITGGTAYKMPDSGFTRAGYIFTGWYTTADGTGGTAYTVGTSYSPTADLKLYAQWKAAYTVTYDGNGATAGAAPAVAKVAVGASGTVASNTGLLAKSGYVFGGWNTKADGSGTAYAAGATITPSTNTTLYAQWTAAPFAITYNGNGSTGGTAPTAGSFTTGGTAYTIAGNTGTLVKTGYAFAGWNSKADGTGDAYSVGDKYSTAAALTLYAQWVAGTYTITYNANGATTGVAPFSGVYTTSGPNYVVLDNYGLLALEGYTFAGWNTKADGTGTDYKPLALYNTAANAVFYAKWVKGTTVAGKTISVKFKARSTVLSATAKNALKSLATLALSKSLDEIDIVGYASARDSSSASKRLAIAKARALAVEKYLLKLNDGLLTVRTSSKVLTKGMTVSVKLLDAIR